MAERTVVMAANLTCGTTMGILGHPLFQDRDQGVHPAERPVATAPHWDVLIIDEASKTLTQEFLVPALLARRHVIVGDVRQLPPFSDRAEITANLRSLVDDRGRELFPPDHQRAMLVLFRLRRRAIKEAGLRWLVVESPGVIEWIAREIHAEASVPFTVARVVSRSGRGVRNLVEVTVADVLAGAASTLHLAAADFVLVGDDQLAARLVPAPGRPRARARPHRQGWVRTAESDPWLFRHAAWMKPRRPLCRTYRERRDTDRLGAGGRTPRAALARGATHADEMAWRITRLHELRWSRNDEERERLSEDLARLKPAAVDIDDAIGEIQDISLPSVLEVIQEGTGAERAERRSALTEGLSRAQTEAFAARFERLSYQHRMHPEISAFRARTSMTARRLRDANTIAQRDERLGWDYAPFGARRVWLDVEGREQQGINADEVRAMRHVIEDFVRWAKSKGARRRASDRWEVACLSFYVQQERAIARMLRELTGDRSARRASSWHGVEIVCGTVDRFQGREADLVLLSLRNTKRVGFLDSPNRLNVAVTRARQQLVVIGKAGYFKACGIRELQELVGRSAHELAKNWLGGRR